MHCTTTIPSRHSSSVTAMVYISSVEDRPRYSSIRYSRVRTVRWFLFLKYRIIISWTSSFYFYHSDFRMTTVHARVCRFYRSNQVRRPYNVGRPIWCIGTSRSPRYCRNFKNRIFPRSIAVNRVIIILHEQLIRGRN